MEFRAGLVFIARPAAEDIIRAAEEGHLPVFVITTPEPTGRETFFDSVRAVLPLNPPVPNARSWEALADSLWEGIRLLPSKAAVIVWLDAPAFKERSREEYEIAVWTLRDITETLSDPVATVGHAKTISVYVDER